MSRRRPGSRHYARLDRRRWARVRKACLDRDGWRCTNCGGTSALEAHHLIRLEDGGDRYDPGNLATLCRACHIEEHRPEMSENALKWRQLVLEMMSEG